MAQQDTGLGWSAKAEYLVNLPVNVAGVNTFTLPGYPCQPIPITGTAAVDIGTNGIKIAESDNNELFAGASISNCFVGVYISGRRLELTFIAPAQGSNLVYFVSRHKETGTYGTVEYGSYWQYQGVSAGTTFYYYRNVYTSYGTNVTSEMPDYDRNQLLANIVYTSVYFSKINEGYAVACVAKWKTPVGAIFESPILISTESEYTDMETDQSGISLSKLNVLYNGRRFYMAFFDRQYDGQLATNLPVIDRSYSDAPSFTLEQLFNYIAKDEYANILVTLSPDPYQENDGSGEAGGDGEEDDADNIDFTDPPSTSIGATGFLTIFCPTLTELRSLATFMWSSFDVDNWRKLFANPMDAILGLHIIPVPANITGTKAVKVGGIDTTIDMSYTTLRYIRRPMGTCEIPKKWGAYLDYSPYTKVSIFLPYIGFKELDADDIMGKTIALQYIIDILTGACVAELKCGDTVLYSWQGNCANEVPISGSDWRGAISSALGIAATVATTVATGGATAPMVAGTIASIGANSLNLKPTINRSGSISGSAGFISNQRPYIIRSIPNLVIPTDQNKFIGYPSFITASLGSLTGYNEIASIHLEGIPATGNELSEIETLLKGGVIF